ncbi:MAG: hypothetical protein ABIK96_15465 [bacterium]
MISRAEEGRTFGFRRCGRSPVYRRGVEGAKAALLLGLLVALAAATGCNDEDCVNCIQLEPPVVPTGVHSISGDNYVIVQWYDIAYSPYDGRYNDNVVKYLIYSRDFIEGDQYDPDRTFTLWGEVAWDENFDPTTGLHWFYDEDALNGSQYEYAVSAVNAAGMESALSFEFVADAPLPQGVDDDAVEIFDSVNGSYTALGGFDFSRAAQFPGDQYAGRVDPNVPASTADIRVFFEGTVPMVETTSPNVLIQDAGNPQGPAGLYWWERVSWAPAEGYSHTGRMELTLDHIYVVEIYDPATQTLHYAKLGVVDVAATQYVKIFWAYQLIPNLPELKAPEVPVQASLKPGMIRL